MLVAACTGIGAILLIIIIVLLWPKGGNNTATESSPVAQSIIQVQTAATTTAPQSSETIASTEASASVSEPVTEPPTEPVIEQQTTTEQKPVETTALPEDFAVRYPAYAQLPTVYITTANGQGIYSKHDYTAGTFSMNANGTPGFNSVADCPMRIRGRGNSTWVKYDKKSFKMNFDTKIALMGEEKDKDWVLIANYYDRTLTRNNLAYQLAKSLSNLKYTCDSYPVDVYLNGQYYGVYDLCEQLEVAGGRIEMEKDKTAVDSGFFIEVYGDDPAKNIDMGSLRAVTIKYPKDYTQDQRNYVVGYIEIVDKIVCSGANLAELEQYVNIDSFIDWLLLMEFTYNWDASFTRNVYMYKPAGGKLEFGPAWDFDLAMGSFGYDDPTYQSWALSFNGLVGRTWATYVYDNPEFMQRIRNRWIEVRDILMGTVDNYLAQMLLVLNNSYNANYQRWMLPVDGQNIQWEWETEYTKRTLPELYQYLQQFFDYRYYFLNNALVDGNYPEKKPKAV